MRLLAILAFCVSSAVAFTGCSEEEKAEAKELWLGIPNRTTPKAALLDPDPADAPSVAMYKKKAQAARAAEYEKMSNRKSMEMFAEKADSLDLQNIIAIMHTARTPAIVDDHFEKRLALQLPPPQRRYTPMDFNTGPNGDIHRMAGAMQDLSSEMMRQGAIEAERKAIQEARTSLNSYAIRMEQAKMSALRHS